MPSTRVLAAEVVGTMWLVFGGCGSAVLAANHLPDTNLGIGLVGVSLAFGLTVLTGAYALGHISGGHFNPAVTVGLWVAGKVEAATVLPYVVAQVLGGFVGAGVLAVIANGQDGFDLEANGFAANGFADHSPGGYDWLSVFVAEAFLTAVFLVVILGVTSRLATAAFAPIAIGLSLTLIHLISIPVSNTSVNPARSAAPAVYVGDWAVEQLWMFVAAPLVGAVVGAVIHRMLLAGEDDDTATSPPPAGDA